MMIKTTKPYSLISDMSINANGEDGIQVCHHGSTVQNCSIHNVTAQAGHIDAIQLIPSHAFCGGLLENITISRNSISSSANIQGVFASDGLFKNLKIIKNVIQTSHPHQITINGMLSGEIHHNYDHRGQVIAATLNPLRLGGSHNIWIMSFDNASKYEYQSIYTTNHQFILDNRDKNPIMPKMKGILAYNVPLEEIITEYLKFNPNRLNGVNRANSVKKAFEIVQQKYNVRVAIYD